MGTTPGPPSSGLLSASNEKAEILRQKSCQCCGVTRPGPGSSLRGSGGVLGSDQCCGVSLNGPRPSSQGFLPVSSEVCLSNPSLILPKPSPSLGGRPTVSTRTSQKEVLSFLWVPERHPRLWGRKQPTPHWLCTQTSPPSASGF